MRRLKVIKNDNLEGRIYHRVGVLRVWGHILRGLGYLSFVGSLSTIPCALIVAAAPGALGATTGEALIFASAGLGGLMLAFVLALSSLVPAITLVVIANLLFGFADHLEFQYLIYDEATIQMPVLTSAKQQAGGQRYAPPGH